MTPKHFISLILWLLSLTFAFASCNGNTPIIDDNQQPNDTTTPNSTTKMKLIVGEKTFIATLADTPSAKAFVAKLPLTLDMADYGGFEKVANIGTLPSADHRENSLGLGDIMLYSSNTLVLFYANHGGYSYTRIGKVDDTNGLREALGSGNVTIKFELQ